PGVEVSFQGKSRGGFADSRPLCCRVTYEKPGAYRSSEYKFGTFLYLFCTSSGAKPPNTMPCLLAEAPAYRGAFFYARSGGVWPTPAHKTHWGAVSAPTKGILRTRSTRTFRTVNGF